MDQIEVWDGRLWPFHAAVRSPLSSAECAARLLAVTCRSSENDKQLAGEFDESGGWLSLANSRYMQSTMTITFAPRGAGTEIRGRTRGDQLQFLLGLFMAIVVTPVALVFLWHSLVVSPPDSFSMDTLLPILVPAVFVVVGVQLPFKVRRTARRHNHEFALFLADAVGGEVITEPVAPPTPHMKNIVQ